MFTLVWQNKPTKLKAFEMRFQISGILIKIKKNMWLWFSHTVTVDKSYFQENYDYTSYP